jgi:hypothetical protein
VPKPLRFIHAIDSAIITLRANAKAAPPPEDEGDYAVGETDVVIVPETSVVEANPWIALPRRAPFILPSDRPYVDAWNELCGETKERILLRLDLLPEPFSGPRESPVLVLGRNPGWVGVGSRQHASPFAQALQRNLLDEPSHHLNVGLLDTFARTASGIRARRVFRPITRFSDLTFEDLSRRVLSVSFHGYHSQYRTTLPVTLPSQWFGFDLVRRASKEGSFIVILHDRGDWNVAVPELLDSPRVFAVSKNGRTISPETLPPAAFDEVVSALRR